MFHIGLLNVFIYLVLVAIPQLDANQIPVPAQNQFHTIKENATTDSVLFSILATDSDPADNLSFQYVGGLEDPSLLGLGTPRKVAGTDTWECDVILNGILDRDNRLPVRNLVYEVKDGDPNSVPVPFKVLMIVDDVNDNPPRFDGLPYQASVSENEQTSTSIFKVSATDPDNGFAAKIQYFMEAKNAADVDEYRKTFSLDPYSGIVTLIRPLDYSTRSFYHFDVSSKDEGQPQCPGPQCFCNATHLCEDRHVDLFITIVDEQTLPPVFENLPYYKSIKESMVVDSTVLQVSAVDGDRGVARPNNISFSLSNDSYIPFKINETTGVIIVADELDADHPNVRSKGGLYIFSVIATEKTDGILTDANSTTQVTVTVTDTNDNIPHFERTVYEASILENTPRGVPLSLGHTIKVSDKDQGLNSQFRLSVEKEDGDKDLNFDTIPSRSQTVQGSTTVTIIVNSTQLDYETEKNFTVKLVAREVLDSETTARSSEAIIKIIIKDANDHNPRFLTTQTSFNVSEDAKINDTVAIMEAEDLDCGEFGQVTFSLENTGNDMAFKIDEDGNITVASKLNREALGLYSLMVVAMDNPGETEDQRRRSLQRLTIHVIDVNDNDPVWPKVFPLFSLSETEKLGQNIGYLRATDDDVGQNGQITYSIAPGSHGYSLFGVNKTSDGWADLYVRSNLTGQSGSCDIDVIATDNGKEPRSSNVTITVVIVDVNLHKPQFVDNDGRVIDNLTISFEEELNLGTNVANLTAKDKDKGENSKVEYYLIPNKDSKFFRIDRINGSLTISDRMDGDVKESYEIEIEARDNGQPTSLSSDIFTMFITLTDIDDNSPSYNATERFKRFEMSVAEENATAVVGKVLPANDKDTSPENSIVCYYLYGGDNLDSLLLNKTTGLLSLMKKLDRESTEQFDIVVKASADCNETIVPIPSNNPTQSSRPKMYNESDLSLLWVHITVTDRNDHAPVFKDKEYSAGVIFSVDIGSAVLSLMESVTDEDSPKNSQNTFRLLGYNTSAEMAQSLYTNQQAFEVSKGGNITTAIRFRPDMSGFFLLKVQVFDKDGQKDTTQVKIYIVSNLERVKLVFNKLPNEVEQLKDKLLKDLSDVLGFEVIADKIVSHTNADGTTDPTKTDVFIHGRYKDTGEVVSAPKLWRAFDFNQAASSILLRNGVYLAEDLIAKEEESDDDSQRIYVILIAAMAIVLIALFLVFINMMRIYRRRLKAATTIAFASPKDQEMYEHPGTNKYYAAENPLFGKEIKNVELEVDKLSNDSLDVNAVDKFSKNNIEAEEEQEVVLQITDSALSTPQHNNNGHLDKVLQEYENSMKPDELGQENASPSHNAPKKTVPLSGRRSTMVIPGLGTEIQEGVTRFSDESLSGDSGFPEGENGLPMNKSYLEYSDI